MKGMNLRMAWLCCATGSSLFGLIAFWEAIWDATSSTGSTRYAMASCQPTGGAPSTKGNSQDRPEPWGGGVWHAR